MSNQKGTGRMHRSIKVLVSVLIAGMVLFMGYTQIRKWHRAGLDRVLSEEKAACGEEIAALNADIESIRNELMQLKDTGEYERRLSEIFGEKTDYLSFGNDSSCNDLLLQVRTFLNYMEQQDYMGYYKGSGLHHRSPDLGHGSQVCTYRCSYCHVQDFGFISSPGYCRSGRDDPYLLCTSGQA